MTRLTRFALAILDALDGLCRRSRRPSAESKIRITVIGAEETAAALDALGALAASLPSDPEPETITELVAGTPAAPPPVAPSGNPRVLGHMLVCPGVGAVAWVGVGVPREGRDGVADAQVGWARRMPVHIDDVLVVPTEDGARSLLWAIRWAVPPTTEVLPVVVGTGAR